MDERKSHEGRIPSYWYLWLQEEGAFFYLSLLGDFAYDPLDGHIHILTMAALTGFTGLRK